MSQVLEETRRARSRGSWRVGEDDNTAPAREHRLASPAAGPPPHVLQIFQPEIGGVPAYLAALVPGLRTAGFQVSVAGPTGVEVIERLGDPLVDLVPLEVGRAPHPLRDAVAVARLARFCRERHVSVIHGHSTKAGLLAALAGARAGIPTVYTPHGWTFERTVAVPVRLAYAQYERQLVRRFHAEVVTNSDSGREAAERWRVAPRGSVHVVSTGLPNTAQVDRNVARRRLGIADGQIVAAWVGRAASQKRPRDLIPIARGLQGQVQVVAVCAGAHGTPLEHDLRRAGVLLTDSSCDPAIVYGAADMLVQTSEWEDAPLAVLEAMSAGLPVIAYDVGGVGEQVRSGRTGYLVLPGDIAMLCECARSLADRPALRIRMGTAARQRVQREFRYGDMVRALSALYADLSACSTYPGPKAAPQPRREARKASIAL